MLQIQTLFQWMLKSKSKTTTSNRIFQLSTKVTPILLLLSAMTVSTRQFFGDPIRCDVGKARDTVRDEVLEAYCWMYADFRLPQQYKGPCFGQQPDDNIGNIYNSYYQWVPIYLICLSFVFYLPSGLWFILEGGLMKFLGNETSTRIIENSKEKQDKLLKVVLIIIWIKLFHQNIRKKCNSYYFRFIFCEMINVVVVLVGFGMTNRFLEYRWQDYGFQVWKYYSLSLDEQQLSFKSNPMCYTFPRIASCSYYRFGQGGFQENIEALCILSLNVVNEKIFLVIWWWFLTLFIIDVAQIGFRVAQIFSARLRCYLLKRRIQRYVLETEEMKEIRVYVSRISKGEWFVLYQMSNNINHTFFMDFLCTLARQNDQNIENRNSLEMEIKDSPIEILI